MSQTLSLGVTRYFPPFLSPPLPCLWAQKICGLFPQTRSPILCNWPFRVFLIYHLSPDSVMPYEVIGGIFKNRKQKKKNRKQLVSVSCLLHCKNLTLPSPTRPSVSLPVYSAITLYDSTLNLHTSTTGFLSVSLQC